MKLWGLWVPQLMGFRLNGEQETRGERDVTGIEPRTLRLCSMTSDYSVSGMLLKWTFLNENYFYFCIYLKQENLIFLSVFVKIGSRGNESGQTV